MYIKYTYYTIYTYICKYYVYANLKSHVFIKKKMNIIIQVELVQRKENGSR